jgi:hypothetical protein
MKIRKGSGAEEWSKKALIRTNTDLCFKDVLSSLPGKNDPVKHGMTIPCFGFVTQG